MKFHLPTLFISIYFFAIVVFFSEQAHASCIVDYKTTISNIDRHNSKGVRLRTVGAILRQDRANFHRFKLKDPGDEGDSALWHPKRRAIFERAVNNRLPSPINKNILGNEEIKLDILFNFCGRKPYAGVGYAIEPDPYTKKLEHSYPPITEGSLPDELLPPPQ